METDKQKKKEQKYNLKIQEIKNTEKATSSLIKATLKNSIVITGSVITVLNTDELNDAYQQCSYATACANLLISSVNVFKSVFYDYKNEKNTDLTKRKELGLEIVELGHSGKLSNAQCKTLLNSLKQDFYIKSYQDELNSYISTLEDLLNDKAKDKRIVEQQILKEKIKQNASTSTRIVSTAINLIAGLMNSAKTIWAGYLDDQPLQIALSGANSLVNLSDAMDAHRDYKSMRNIQQILAETLNELDHSNVKEYSSQIESLRMSIREQPSRIKESQPNSPLDDKGYQLQCPLTNSIIHNSKNRTIQSQDVEEYKDQENGTDSVSF